MTVLEKQFRIINELGLHARAATLFVQTAGRFDAQVEVQKDQTAVDGKSIMGMLMLIASKGSTITVRTQGPDAEEALGALGDLISSGFGEIS